MFSKRPHSSRFVWCAELVGGPFDGIIDWLEHTPFRIAVAEEREEIVIAVVIGALPPGFVEYRCDRIDETRLTARYVYEDLDLDPTPGLRAAATA